MEHSSVDEDTRTQTAVEVKINKVAKELIRRRRVPPFSQSGQVGVILEVNRPLETIPQDLPNLDIKPAERLGGDDMPGGSVDGTRHGNTDAEYLVAFA